MNDLATLRRVLGECRSIAVVGLSADWYRPSYFAAKYMRDRGYRIIPVNPKYARILDETCYPDLASIPGKVDMVDVFRKPDAVPGIVEDAIAIGAKSVWMQEGVVNNAAADRARAAGLVVVMDRCLLKEHRKL